MKIINRSPRPAINIRVQFLLRIKKNVPDGMLINNKFLNLKTDEMFEISEFNLGDKTAGYAKRFVCIDNIEEIWNDDNGAYLTFRLIATDSISGFQKVFKRSYYTKRTDIKEGSHRFGNSLDVA